MSLTLVSDSLTSCTIGLKYRCTQSRSLTNGAGVDVHAHAGAQRDAACNVQFVEWNILVIENISYTFSLGPSGCGAASSKGSEGERNAAFNRSDCSNLTDK